MSRSSCSPAERACAISSSTKVGAVDPHTAHLAKSPADTKIVYRRYASLFFIAGCESADNELINLEVVHRYVEQMDKYYGNVCELDIIFNFQKAYFILDELLLAGELQESSKKNVLRCIGQQDSLEDMEVGCDPHLFARCFHTLGIADACSLFRPRMTSLPRSCSVPPESTAFALGSGVCSIRCNIVPGIY